MVSAFIYGLFAYFVIYVGIANRVMMHSYLWNIVFIIIFLILDYIANETLLDDRFIITKKTYLFAMIIHSAYLISFKTTLYLFYIFALVVSRVSILDPSIFGEDFRNFILAIEYCLILLVVFDKFVEYLAKEDKKVRRITAKFDRFARFIESKRKKVKK